MKCDSLDIANYIINYSIDKGVPVSNLKLQKLLYYVQAASLVEKEGPMFDEGLSAWKYGPVVESVFHEYKLHLNLGITDRVATKMNYIFEELKEDYDPAKHVGNLDAKIIKRVVTSYKPYTALDMVDKTCGEQPWQEAFNEGRLFIPPSIMCKYYTEHKDLIFGDHNERL